ncbi:MAG: AsmA-like C-terminal region-containing protein, partial [Pseudomonadota bacterium]
SEDVWVEATVGDLMPSTLAQHSRTFAPLKGFDFPVSGTARVQFGLDGTIRAAEADLAAQAGIVSAPMITDEAIPLDRAFIKATYAIDTGRFEIANLDYAGAGNRMSLSGVMDLAFEDGKIGPLQSADLDLKVRNAAVDLPKFFDQPTEFDRATLKGTWDGPSDTLAIERFNVTLAETEVSLYGSVTVTDTTPAISLDGTVSDFDTSRLSGLWPKGLFVPARAWVVNRVTGGRMTEGRLTVRAEAGDLAQAKLPNDLLRFDYRVEDASAIVLKGLPPVEGVDADMTLLGNAFSLTLDEGYVRQGVNRPAVFLPGTTVEIPDLGVKGSPVKIRALARAAIPDGLRIIDHEPLGFASALGVDPQALSGIGEIDMRFGLPLVTRVPIDEITFEATAQLRDVSFQNVVGPIDVTGGRLDLTIDRERLRGEGTIDLLGEPAELAWEETFFPSRMGPSRYDVRLEINDAMRGALGLPVSGLIEGVTRAEIKARGRGFIFDDYRVDADLTETGLALAPIGLTKAQGVPARLSADVSRRRQGGIAVRSLALTGDAGQLDGRFSLARDGRLLSADLPLVRLGRNDLAVRADRDEANGLLVTAAGRSLDLGPVLEALAQVRPLFGEGEEETDGPRTTEDSNDFSLDLSVETLHLQDEVTLGEVDALLALEDKTIGKARLTAKQVAGPMAMSLQDSASGIRELLFEAQDAGALLRGLTGRRLIDDGALRVAIDLDGPPGAGPATGKPLGLAPESLQVEGSDASPVEEDQPGRAAPDVRDLNLAAVGEVEIEDFTIRNAPVLTHLLTIGSLRGLSDTLAGEGIWFRGLTSNFTLNTEGLLQVRDGRMAGPALGITAEGSYDTVASVANVNGTIVPSYSINSALGNLPVVGNVLVSKEGEGVFGFTYGVAGRPDNLRLSVNPLSGLAPGILRRLFQLGNGAPPPADQQARDERVIAPPRDE